MAIVATRKFNPKTYTLYVRRRKLWKVEILLCCNFNTFNLFMFSKPSSRESKFEDTSRNSNVSSRAIPFKLGNGEYAWVKILFIRKKSYNLLHNSVVAHVQLYQLVSSIHDDGAFNNIIRYIQCDKHRRSLPRQLIYCIISHIYCLCCAEGSDDFLCKNACQMVVSIVCLKTEGERVPRELLKAVRTIWSKYLLPARD